MLLAIFSFDCSMMVIKYMEVWTGCKVPVQKHATIYYGL